MLVNHTVDSQSDSSLLSDHSSTPSQIPPLQPPPQHPFRHVPHKNMHMVHPPHTLQTHPILEPHHLLPPTLHLVNKELLDKLHNHLPALHRNVAACVVDSDGRLGPDEEVHDTGFETVGPVV